MRFIKQVPTTFTRQFGLITLCAALVMAFATCVAPSSAAADWPVDDADYMQAYDEDRICYAHSDNERGLVAVFDTFEVRWDINAGSTSAFILPCIPTACPDGFFLVSGNLCSVTDPFVDIPWEDEPTVRDVPVSVDVVFVVDVGGLIEPFTPDGVVVGP